MPPKQVASRAEPARTRKSSKKERETKSSGDIMDALSKMAPKSSVEDTLNNSVNKKSTLSATIPEEQNNNTKANERNSDNEVFSSNEQAINAQGRKDKDNHDNNNEDERVASQEADETCTQIEDEEQELRVDTSEVLVALKELTNNYAKADDTINHPTKGIGAQVVKLTLRADDLYSDIHGAVSGLLVRVQKLEQQNQEKDQKIQHMEESQKRLTAMIAENKRLSTDLVLAQGLIQKFNQKTQLMEGKILELTRRGMEQNITIHGLEEMPYPSKELCSRSVLDFFQDMLQVDLDESDIWRAYRMGKLNKDKARPVFVKLSYSAKDKVMENVSKLKDKKNKHSQTYFVSEQIPEGLVENRKQLSNRAKTLREQEAAQPEPVRQEIKIIGDKLVRAGEVVNPPVTTPQPYELFPGIEEQKKINALAVQLKETNPIYEKNSTFVGLAIDVTSIHDVQLAYKAVMQRFPYMDHVMLGYQVQVGAKIQHGSCDDQEYGGGAAIDKHLYNNRLKDLAVFVVRRYGGIHLGFNRFRTIQKAAAEAIALLHP